MEPFFSVLLSSLFLGETPSLAVIGSLLPVVGGVALASTSEVTFNWPGFLAAMGSNVTFQSRNVFSKKFMAKAKVCALLSFTCQDAACCSVMWTKPTVSYCPPFTGTRMCFCATGISVPQLGNFLTQLTPLPPVFITTTCVHVSDQNSNHTCL